MLSKTQKKNIRDRKMKKEEKIIQAKIDLDVIAKSICDLFVKQRLYATCLPASLIFHEILDMLHIENQLINGYQCILNGGNAYMKHFWVRALGKDYDIGLQITRDISKLNIETKLCETLPADAKTIDNETPEEKKNLLEIEQAYALYQKNVGEFWQLAPGNVYIIRQLALGKEQLRHYK